MRHITIDVGDRVGYRVAFLRSIGMTHSPMAHARGTVTALERFGGAQLASVEWAAPHQDMPPRVLDQNLARVGSLAFTSEDA
jgi:hypothetical protein